MLNKFIKETKTVELKENMKAIDILLTDLLTSIKMMGSFMLQSLLIAKN